MPANRRLDARGLLRDTDHGQPAERRILRKIAEDDFSNLGDTSMLAEPAVVDDLLNNRQNKRAGARA